MRYKDVISFKISALESQHKKKNNLKIYHQFKKKCGKIIELEVSAMLKNDNKKI